MFSQRILNKNVLPQNIKEEIINDILESLSNHYQIFNNMDEQHVVKHLASIISEMNAYFIHHVINGDKCATKEQCRELTNFIANECANKIDEMITEENKPSACSI